MRTILRNLIQELNNKVVRRWGIGVNSYYEYASYHLEEQRLPVFLLQEANWMLCGVIPEIDFPKDSKVAEEYGNLQTWWHCKICDPVFEYVNSRTRHISLDTVALDQMRRRHPEATAWLDTEEEQAFDVCRDENLRSKMFLQTAEGDGKVFGEL